MGNKSSSSSSSYDVFTGAAACLLEIAGTIPDSSSVSVFDVGAARRNGLPSFEDPKFLEDLSPIAGRARTDAGTLMDFFVVFVVYPIFAKSYPEQKLPLVLQALQTVDISSSSILSETSKKALCTCLQEVADNLEMERKHIRDTEAAEMAKTMATTGKKAQREFVPTTIEFMTLTETNKTRRAIVNAVIRKVCSPGSR